MSNFKNNIFKGLMVSCMVVPQVIPVTSFAIDKNAVTTNGAQYATDSSNSVKTNTEAASQEQAKQNINITDEAYASFSGIKTSFQTMQSQYGNLSDTNMSTGYQTYLNQVQNDKDNLALNYKLVAQKSGKYSVSENGLVLSQDKANALADALSSTAEDKKAMLEEDETSNTTTVDGETSSGSEITDGTKLDTETKDSSETTVSENDSFVSKNAFGSQYQQAKEDNAKKEEEAAAEGESSNEAIAKSYANLQATLKASQKTIESDIKKAKQVKFSSIVDGFSSYKSQATNAYNNAKVDITAAGRASSKKKTKAMQDYLDKIGDLALAEYEKNNKTTEEKESGTDKAKSAPQNQTSTTHATSSYQEWKPDDASAKWLSQWAKDHELTSD